jgi:hypothetical protein
MCAAGLLAHRSIATRQSSRDVELPVTSLSPWREKVTFSLAVYSCGGSCGLGVFKLSPHSLFIALAREPMHDKMLCFS